MDILITGALVALAFWQRDDFLYLIGGVSCIAEGIFTIDFDAGFGWIYICAGIACIGLGIYMIIKAIMNLINGARGN